MKLSCTVYEILLVIFQKLIRSRDSDHAHLSDGLSSVGWDLLCSINVPNLKCLRLPATKIWRATPNVKIFVLSHPLGNFGVTHRVHLWINGKRVVDFLLVVIELFSLALMAAALLSEICRNQRFLKGGVTLSANFKYEWMNENARILSALENRLRADFV